MAPFNGQEAQGKGCHEVITVHQDQDQEVHINGQEAQGKGSMRSSLSIRIKIRKFISMAKRHRVREA
jgi:hypothetical protein